MKRYHSMVSLFLVTALAMTGSVALASAKDVESTQPYVLPEHETESAVSLPVEREEEDVLYVEPCASCGGEVITRKSSESGYIKGIYSPCEHGLNGNVWTNMIVYTSICSSCEEGFAFTERVREVRCNH